MEWNRELLYHTYSYFAKELYRNNFTLEKRSDQVAEKFIKALGKEFHLERIGEDFLWKYCLFQFDYWSKLTISSFDKKMRFSLIFGEKALQRYNSRNSDFDFLIKECDVKLSRKKCFTPSFEGANLCDIESFYRKQKLNTEEGLVHCLTHTTLYLPSDISCKNCSYSSDCIEILSHKYPNLYLIRKI